MSEEKIVWLRRKTNAEGSTKAAQKNAKVATSPVLLARRIRKGWLESTFETLEVRFSGALQSALMDLADAARAQKQNLPIGALRLLLQATVGNLASVSRTLGCEATKGNEPAIALYVIGDDNEAATKDMICTQIQRWYMDTLDVWASRMNFSPIAARVKKAIAAENLMISRAQVGMQVAGRANFPAIARQIADRLAGTELFRGLGPCELIFPSPYGGFSSPVELMTAPRRAANGTSTFSMVASINLSTVPYSDDLYFSLSAAKRVWADCMPTGFNTGKRATAYVMVPGRPTLTVTVDRRKEGETRTWNFNDEYAALAMESDGELPESLEAAFSKLAYEEGHWWVGLPQLPRLYRRVEARSVFEGDDALLLEEAERCIPDIIENAPPNFSIQRLALNAKPSSAMLKLEDFGVAGASIADKEGDEDEPEDIESENSDRQAVADFRSQCAEVLKGVHGDRKLHLWIIGGNEREQSYMTRIAEKLFGDGVAVSTDPLPADVHGLKEKLPGNKKTAKLRFTERIRAWQQHPLLNAIAQYDGPRFVLICAAKDIARKTEDTVNRRAAIHAVCSIAKANVHHVLPIEETNSEFRAGKAAQSFIHRVQSAMMDVMLAHSGYIIGAREFVTGCLGSATPAFVYGIQALRKNAQQYSGEQPVCMAVYTRLRLDTNVTEIQFGYKEGNATKRSSWMKLSDGLIWLGCQRQMQGDEDWLLAEFAGMTVQVLQEAHEEDPRAIVMINWDTLPKLWKELTDENLSRNDHVTIGHVKLPMAFPMMSFVRLRSRGAKLALRVHSETAFEGYREGTTLAPTGELYADAYTTTLKRLIEINPHDDKSTRHGHFIGVMSYRKTTQIKRGLSCYRPTIRMTSSDNRDKGVFTKAVLPPSDMDAALPAATDITIMHAPDNVALAEIANVVMGLRLGYAHYDDWTRLPAPLFFERKIDDYIIKYPESEDDDVYMTEDDGSDNVEISASPILQKVANEIASELAPATNEPIPDVTPIQATMNFEPPTEIVPLPSENAETDFQNDLDILAQAKRIDIPSMTFHPLRDFNIRRTYGAMIRGEIPVRVDLPYFVRVKGFFEPLDNHAKKRVKSHWKQMVELDYVRSRTKCPAVDQFLDWLASFMLHPQGIGVVNSSILFDREIIVPELNRALNEFNATAAKHIEEVERDGTPYIDLSPLVISALEAEDDHTLGWLIFTAAQTPNYGVAKSIVPTITKILGPKTEAALHYYVQAAHAAAKLIEAGRNGKPHLAPIHLTGPQTKAPVLPVMEVIAGPEMESVPDQTETMPGSPMMNSDASVRTFLGDDQYATVIQTREDLVRIVSELQPGNETFNGLVERVRALLSELECIDVDYCEQKEAENQKNEAIDKLVSEAQVIIRQLQNLDESVELLVSYARPTAAEYNDAKVEYEKVRESIKGAVQAKSNMDAFYATPLPAKASIVERTQHLQQTSVLLMAFSEAMEGANQSVRTARYFEITVLEELPPVEKTASEQLPMTEEGSEPIAVSEPEEMNGAEVAITSSVSVEEPELVSVESETSPYVDVDIPGEPVMPEPRMLPQAEIALPEPEEVVVETGVEKPVPQAVVGNDPSNYDNDQLRARIGRIEKMIVDRDYALAEVYIDALRLAYPQDPAIASHASILVAMCRALDAIDCRFALDTRLDAGLQEILNTQKEVGTFSTVAGSAMGVMAAGMVNMLFSNLSGESDNVRWGILEWVEPPLTGIKSLSLLISLLGTMESRCVQLTREKLAISRVGEKIARDKERFRAIQRAAHWNEDALISPNLGHQGYTRIHEHIYGHNHPIGRCVELIAKGEFRALADAYNQARRDFGKPAATIADVHKKIGERGKPVGGRISVSACENIVTTEKFVLDCLRFADTQSDKQNQLAKNEAEFLNELAALLTAAIYDIQQMQQPERPLDYIYAHGLSVIFNGILRLFDDQTGAYCIPEIQQRLLIQLPMDKAGVPSMKPVEEFGLRALCAAEDVLSLIEDLIDEDLAALPLPVSESAILPILGEAMRSHVAERRFLPAFTIAAIPGVQVKLEPPLLQQYQKSRADLSRDLQDARQRVTHAMALSAMNQLEAGNLLRIIEVLSAANTGEHAIGHPEGASTAYPDFPHALAALRTDVLDVLDMRMQETRSKLEAELDALLGERGDSIQPEIKRIREMLAANTPASLRTAYDACGIVRNGGRLPSNLSHQEPTAANEFDAFTAAIEQVRGHQHLIETLIAHLESTDSVPLPACCGNLDPEQRVNAAEFLKLWQSMCLERDRAKAADLAGKFFASIGILEPYYMQDTSRAVRHTRISFPERAFAGLSVECFIPPALGSPSSNVNGFIISGNQGETEINNVIQDIGSSPTFVMARSRLTLAKRAKISFHAPVILIDDYMVAYIAMHPEDRARRMMEIGLLTFHTQPYSADGISVPKEMFFGRRKELQSLRNVPSLAVLYGGRRLGKSSLLAQICREMNRQPGVAALYMPMKDDYDGGDHVLYTWRILARALAAQGVIDHLPKEENSVQPIRKWIEAQISAPTQQYKTLYLLFDEADDLMGKELDLGQGAIGMIGSLQSMAETLLQFKVTVHNVIAGLHNLTRMTTESNSALGKADVIALEPFNTGDDILRGIELVTKPMAALGFFFGPGNENLPLQILSVCNYYPAFIQVYCKKLLEHMYNNKRQRGSAVTPIERSDLDAVENDHDLLAEMQKKFGYTLDLDKRYKAIALLLAEYYYSEVESGKNEGLTVSEIRDYSQVLAGVHFQGLSGAAYESLVDEMRKLNVLEKNGARYRLRNPSIAMLIGDKETIRVRLDSLASELPEKARNHGDRRCVMTAQSAQCVFPMPIAWTTSHMDAIDGDLVILAGNHLSGLMDLTTSAKEWQLIQGTVFRACTAPANAIHSLVQKYRPQPKAKDRGQKTLLTITPTSWKVGDLQTYVTQAQRGAGYRLRLALIANPDRLWELAQAMRIGTVHYGDANNHWLVEPAPAWSTDAIRFHIHENTEVSESVDACEALHRASCGFTKPILSLCGPSLNQAQAIAAETQMRAAGFAKNLPVFYQAIGWPQAIGDDRTTRMQELLTYINGAARDKNLEGDLSDLALDMADLRFLNWMGLLQEGSDDTWVVPPLYLNLIQP